MTAKPTTASQAPALRFDSTVFAKRQEGRISAPPLLQPIVCVPSRCHCWLAMQAPPAASASTATTFASSAEDLEARGLYGEAKAAHQEAARLFRLSSVGVANEEMQQQLRALARHHEARTKFCDAAEAKSELARAQRAGSEIVLAKTQVVVPARESSGNNAQLARAPGTRESRAASDGGGAWDIWRPLDVLMERMFPKDLFGASPPKPAASAIPHRLAKQSLFDHRVEAEEEEEDKNAMLESFMVVQDYQPPSPARPAMRLTKKESSVLDSVVRGKLVLEDDNAELRALVEKLHRQVDEVTEENSRLQERVAELERDKRLMRQSVMTFREEVGRSMIAAGGPTMSSTAQLELLPEHDTRSQLRDSRDAGSRSPSPDIQEYIRSLERRVEQQQLKLDEWSKLFKQQKK